MKKTTGTLLLSVGLGLSSLILFGCDEANDDDKEAVEPSEREFGLAPELSSPDPAHKAEKLSRVLGWPTGKVPEAAPGFSVSEFAGQLDNPRNVYALPNGDILVAESNSVPKGPKEENLDPGKAARKGTSANRISLLRDKDGDGVAEERSEFIKGLNQPFGIALIGSQLYVANTDGLFVFPYNEGDTRITVPGKKILDLPAGGYNNHWTRNLLVKPDQSKILISVGSGSNVAENGIEEEVRRANILEINPDGSGERIVAGGLRNPVGMDWAPGTGALWTVVNERDELGDELVPDYLTSVQDGAFYGWPYSYFGQNEDPRLGGQRPDLVAKALTPELALGAHTASLGLAFAKGDFLPEPFREGAFVAQHGSWNRIEIAGYKVIFTPFKDGKPSGQAIDFLTGFVVDADRAEVYGRPVSVTVLPEKKAVLVVDDSGDKIWAVRPATN